MNRIEELRIDNFCMMRKSDTVTKSQVLFAVRRKLDKLTEDSRAVTATIDLFYIYYKIDFIHCKRYEPYSTVARRQFK